LKIGEDCVASLREKKDEPDRFSRQGAKEGRKGKEDKEEDLQPTLENRLAHSQKLPDLPT
jgi:hypothetical protein